MNRIKTILEFYVFSNLHVALAASFLLKITLLYYGISDLISPIILFFATIIFYHLIRFFRFSEIESFYAKWCIENLKGILILVCISILMVTVLLLKLKPGAIFLLIPFSLVTFYYSFPFGANKMGLRNFQGLKLILIGVIWSGLTVFFPLLQNEIMLDTNSFLMFLQRVFFIIAITIPFDITDMRNDDLSLKTLPQLLGVNKSKFISILLLLLFFQLTFLIDPFNFQILAVNGMVVLISGILISLVNENSGRFLTAFWIESTPIIWFVLSYLII